MNVHFIGIGGIGVSALAVYYIEKGHRVSGSDLTDSEITKTLKKKGAKISIGPHRAENVPTETELVIYSPAVQKENPELQQARTLRNTLSAKTRIDLQKKEEASLQILSYPQALGELSKQHYTVAISGTHGKSTTTAMLGLLLVKAGLDPTVIVGTKLKEFGGLNCRVGRGAYLHKGKPILVIEADEHFASFLNYWPDIILLTSVEADHLDYYKNLANVLRAFRSYVSHLPKGGILVANKDDANIRDIVKSSKAKVRFFSSKGRPAKELRNILKVPGEHNVSNAHAAFTAAKALGVPDQTSYDALREFTGTWRRFEIFELTLQRRSGQEIPYTLVSDYGHHPTEVRVTVEAARSKWPDRQLWLIFQPHQYQRTYYFFRDFANILSRLPVDKLIIADIYDVPGRETDAISQKVSSAKLAQQIQKRKEKDDLKEQTVFHIPNTDQIEKYLKENLSGREVVIVMGAGDIYNLTVRLHSR
jgi:UDP-N-acetylmuramate--alanine ligase